MRKNSKLRLVELLKSIKISATISVVVLILLSYNIEGYSYFNSHITGFGSVTLGEAESWNYPILMVNKGKWYQVIERIVNGDFENIGGFSMVNGQIATSASIVKETVLPVEGSKAAVLGNILSPPVDSKITWNIEEETSDFLIFVNFLTESIPTTSKAYVNLIVNSVVKDSYKISDVFDVDKFDLATSSGYIKLHADLRDITFPATVDLVFSPDKNNIFQKDLLIADMATTNNVYANNQTLFDLRYRTGSEETYLIDGDSNNLKMSEFTLKDGERVIEYYGENDDNSFTTHVKTRVFIKTSVLLGVNDPFVRFNAQDVRKLFYSSKTELSPIYYTLNQYSDCIYQSGTMSGILRKKEFLQRQVFNEAGCVSIKLYDDYGNTSPEPEIYEL